MNSISQILETGLHTFISKRVYILETQVCGVHSHACDNHLCEQKVVISLVLIYLCLGHVAWTHLNFALLIWFTGSVVFSIVGDSCWHLVLMEMHMGTCIWLPYSSLSVTSSPGSTQLFNVGR